MPTTDIQLKNAKTQASDYTITVDTGLSLLVKNTGSKLWRYRYSFAGKRCMISVGKYPQVSMKHARLKIHHYQEMLAQGINPSTHKQTEKIIQSSEKSFQDVVLEWFTKHYKQSNERHKQLVLRRMENHIFPLIGKLPVKSIQAPMLFNIIETIQQAGTIETGKRINGICSMVFRYGVAKGYCDRDVTQDYRGMLQTAKSKHLPTLTKPAEIGELLRDMANYSGTIVTKSALLIAPYVFVRPSEIANSKWEFIDFNTSHWLIPAHLMKMKRAHLIPFPSQVKRILEALYPITGHGDYIFPNENDPTRPIHTESINKVIRRIEDGKYIGRMVSHSFRSIASTILNENKFRSDVIEKQLAHQEKNKVRDAYNHAEYIEERTEMMQWYADYLDSLSGNSNKSVISINSK